MNTFTPPFFGFQNCGTSCPPFCNDCTSIPGFPSNGFGFNGFSGQSFPWGGAGFNSGFNSGFGGFNGFSPFNWNTPFGQNGFGGQFSNFAWNPTWAQNWNGFGNAWNWNQGWNAPASGWQFPSNGFNWNAPFGQFPFGQFSGGQFPFGFNTPFFGFPSWNGVPQTTGKTSGKKGETETVATAPFFPFAFTPFGFVNPACFQGCEPNSVAA